MKYMHGNYLRGGVGIWSVVRILYAARRHTVGGAAINAYAALLGYALVP